MPHLKIIGADKDFNEWFQDTFGYGYGTGERPILEGLTRFLALANCGSHGAQYDFEVMEKELTPIVAWLFICALCKDSCIEYGTSPRYGWLTERGMSIRSFMAGKSIDELYEITCAHFEE
jgi:hypothetical protein